MYRRKFKQGLTLSQRFGREDIDNTPSDTDGPPEKSVEEGLFYINMKLTQEIYQRFPRETSTYTKHPVISWTDSRQSYQKIAKRTRNILHWNNRIPKTEIRLHLKERTLEEISECLTKILRTLQRNTKKRKGLRYCCVNPKTSC